MDIKSKVEKRIKELERFKNRPIDVLFSGGKDSLASLLISIQAGLKIRKIIYTEVTGNTDQKCNNYVHRIVEKLGLKDKLLHTKREDLDFYECLKKWGIPIRYVNRWCLWEFKHRIWKEICVSFQILGMKRIDSVNRKTSSLIQRKYITDDYFILPIYDFTTYEVIDYIKMCGVEINPCYHIYGHSGNCMFCPFHSKEKIILTLQDPYWRKKILNVLTQVEWKSQYSKYKVNRWLQYSNIYSIFNYVLNQLESK